MFDLRFYQLDHIFFDCQLIWFVSTLQCQRVLYAILLFVRSHKWHQYIQFRRKKNNIKSSLSFDTIFFSFFLLVLFIVGAILPFRWRTTKRQEKEDKKKVVKSGKQIRRLFIFYDIDVLITDDGLVASIHIWRRKMNEKKNLQKQQKKIGARRENFIPRRLMLIKSDVWLFHPSIANNAQLCVCMMSVCAHAQSALMPRITS